MRVGIIALLHESNTFIAEPTSMEHFRESWLFVGDQVREEIAGTHHEVAGFFSGLQDEDLEAVPLFAARATPYGTIRAAAFVELLQMMFDQLERQGPLDGYLLAPHGATVSEAFPDADGHWLQELRQRVGNDTPLIATLDPHANLSPEMVEPCNALIAYRSNPHLDQHARGVEAARMMARTLRGEIAPTTAATFPPLAINIERQLTSDPQLTPLYEKADQMLDDPRVLSNSILLGFPYADVAEMGSAALVVTNDDVPLARQLANEMGHYLWEHRQDYVGKMIGVEQALGRLRDLAGRVCLLDMGDNVGGGSPADGTQLAHALHAKNITQSFVCLYDPAAVGKAAAAGVGARLRLAMGGTTDRLHGEPLTVEVTVDSLHGGKFQEPEPRHGGISDCDQGPTAVVKTDRGMTVLLNSKRMPPFSLHQLTSCGIDPEQFRVLVAKGVNAPVAAYAPVCPHLIRVNTKGCTTADMESLPFQYRRRPMFPFERSMEWDSVAD